jgi:hypothetical protein
MHHIVYISHRFGFFNKLFSYSKKSGAIGDFAPDILWMRNKKACISAGGISNWQG